MGLGLEAGQPMGLGLEAGFQAGAMDLGSRAMDPGSGVQIWGPEGSKMGHFWSKRVRDGQNLSKGVNFKGQRRHFSKLTILNITVLVWPMARPPFTQNHEQFDGLRIRSGPVFVNIGDFGHFGKNSDFGGQKWTPFLTGPGPITRSYQGIWGQKWVKKGSKNGSKRGQNGHFWVPFLI